MRFRTQNIIISSIILLSYVLYNKVSASAPWQDGGGSATRESLAVERFHSDLPPNIFAPSGRLVSVEQILSLACNPNDLSSTLAIAIHCSEGIVVVSTYPTSPHLFDHPIKQENCDVGGSNDDDGAEQAGPKTQAAWTTASLLQSSDDLFFSPPFFRLGPSLFGVTGGNAVDAQVVLRSLRNIARAQREEDTLDIGAAGTLTARTVSRLWADRLQVRTQQAQKGRLMAVSVILIDAPAGIAASAREAKATSDTGDDVPMKKTVVKRNRSGCIWQVDPTGLFYECQAAITGRSAPQAQASLQKVLKEYFDQKEKRAKESESQLFQSSSSPSEGGITTQRMRRLSNLELRETLSELTGEEALALATKAIQSVTAKHVNSSLSSDLNLASVRLRGLFIRSSRGISKIGESGSSRIQWLDQNELERIQAKMLNEED